VKDERLVSKVEGETKFSRHLKQLIDLTDPDPPYYAPPLIGGGITRCFCLTPVCLSHTSGLTREQTGLGRLKLVQS